MTSLLFPELQEQTHDTGCRRFFKIRPDAHVSAEWAGHRHKLLHLWNTSKPLAMFAMMNPSGAGIEANDATVNKCNRIADLLGAVGIYAGNSCGYRARDCDELRGWMIWSGLGYAWYPGIRWKRTANQEPGSPSAEFRQDLQGHLGPARAGPQG